MTTHGQILTEVKSRVAEEGQAAGAWRQRPAAMPGSARTAGPYVQYGCGACAPDSWLNFDASPRLYLERIPGVGALVRAAFGTVFPDNVRWGDITRGLPIADGSANGVYCSHVLEHIPREHIVTALRNTERLLAPGGVFRLVVPDLHWRAARYVTMSAAGDRRAADTFMEACSLGKRSRRRGIVEMAKEHYGNSTHLWMYDYATLSALLTETGFSGVRRCAFGDSSDRMFRQVEDAARFMDCSEPELAIEAIKALRGR